MGLTLSDFDALSPSEFDSVYRHYREAETQRLREHWEQTRMLATIFVQPYSKKKVTPHTLMPFPWDKNHPEPEQNKKVEKSTPERLKQLLELLDNGK